MFQNLLAQLPELIGTNLVNLLSALGILIVGWIVARLIAWGVFRLMKRINLGKGYPFLIHKAGAAYNKLLESLVRDDHSGWTSNAARALKELHAKEKIDIVLSSFPPAAAHLAVMKSGLMGEEIRWIADMRDEMSMNQTFSRARKKYYAGLEKKIFSKAWMITAVADLSLHHFQLLGKDSGVRFLKVMNGFDFDLPESYNYNPVFTVTHAGTFYGDRKPGKFFQAVSELIEEKRIANIRINLIGAGNAIVIPSGLAAFVKVTGRIGHDEALKYMMESDANLIVKPESEKGAIPGKLFEYLGTLKPVLALMDKSEQAASIIQKAHSGIICNFDDTEDIKRGILEIHGLWSRKERLPVDREYIKTFCRRDHVKLLQQEILKEN